MTTKRRWAVGTILTGLWLLFRSYQYARALRLRDWAQSSGQTLAFIAAESGLGYLRYELVADVIIFAVAAGFWLRSAKATSR